MPWWLKCVLRDEVAEDGDDAGGGAGVDDAGGVGYEGGVDDTASDGAAGDRAGGKDEERKTGAALTDGMRKAIEDGLAAGGEDSCVFR